MKPLLTGIFILTVFFAPDLAWAQPDVTADGLYTGAGLIPCGQSAANPCNSCHVVILANTIIKWVIGITFMLFAGIAVYSGVKMVISGGNSGALSDAKEMFTNAFIGLLIILGAWLMIDTLLRFVLQGGENGNIEGYGPWSQVECTRMAVAETKPISITELEFVAGQDLGAGTRVVSPGGSGGSCAVATTGNCAVSNLGCFGARAADASKICSMESGGNAAIVSGTDLCQDLKSFSGGLFQINILAHGDKLNNCAPDFFTKNGPGAQGTCLRRVSNSGGVGYCQIRDCRVTNVTKYQSCMRQTLNAQTNIAIACRLFNSRGRNFDDWETSANRCGVQ